MALIPEEFLENWSTSQTPDSRFLTQHRLVGVSRTGSRGAATFLAHSWPLESPMEQAQEPSVPSSAQQSQWNISLFLSPSPRKELQSGLSWVHGEPMDAISSCVISDPSGLLVGSNNHPWTKSKIFTPCICGPARGWVIKSHEWSSKALFCCSPRPFEGRPRADCSLPCLD